jgi:hypothetical protein
MKRPAGMRGLGAAQISLIVLFLLVLVLPALTINRDPEKILILENRRVAQNPLHSDSDIEFHGTEELVYYTGEFLNDNIGFREFASVTNEVGMYSMFRRMNTPYDLTGKDHNLFYVPTGVRDPGAIPLYQPYTEDELAAWADNYDLFAGAYERAGVPFVFVTVPGKEYVYPELYPDTFLQKPTSPRTVQLVSYLREYAGADAMDLTAALCAAKTDQDMVYSKVVDPSHWNTRGAFVGYQNIMENLRKYDPEIEVLSEDDFIITQKVVPKKLAGTDFAFKGFEETQYIYQYRDSSKHPQATLIDVTGRLDVTGTAPGTGPVPPEKMAEYGSGLITYYYQNPNLPNGKKLLILGDSYTYMFLLDYFAESFSELYFIQPHVSAYYYWDFVHDASDAFDPDMVVYEVADRYCGDEGCFE